MSDRDERASEGQDVLAFVMAVTVPTDQEGDDAIEYVEQIISDALSGWGMAVVRIEHLADPATVFDRAEKQT